MNVTPIILYQLSGCLRAFKRGDSYQENVSFKQNVKDYIFRNHITYGTSSDYFALLEKCTPQLPPTKDQLDSIYLNIAKALHETENEKTMAG